MLALGLLLLICDPPDPKDEEERQRAAVEKAMAAYRIYRFTAPDGTTHFTDNLDEVPPDIRKAYLDRLVREALAALDAGETTTPVDEPATALQTQVPVEAPYTPPASRVLKQQQEKYWRDQAAGAQARVKQAEAKAAKAEQALNEMGSAALNAALGRPRGTYEAALQALQAARTELEAAKVYRDRTLPEVARRMGAEPGWVRVRN